MDNNAGNGDGQEEGETGGEEVEPFSCPAFPGYDQTCPENLFIPHDAPPYADGDPEECQLAINAVMFYYTLNQNVFIAAEQNRCADIQGLMTLMTETGNHIF